MIEDKRKGEPMPAVIPSRFTLSLLVAWMGASAQIASGATPPVATCGSITLVRPGIGVSYTGIVRNDDYRLKIVVPRGLTGWGGVAPEAPFHGFVIFFHTPQSCMGLEVHWRVDLGDGVPGRHGAGRAAAVGNRRGGEKTTRGVANGTALTNVTITFSVPEGGAVYDGSVWLVTPTEDLEKNLPTFRNFVSHIRFEPK